MTRKASELDADTGAHLHAVPDAAGGDVEIERQRRPGHRTGTGDGPVGVRLEVVYPAVHVFHLRDIDRCWLFAFGFLLGRLFLEMLVIQIASF